MKRDRERERENRDRKGMIKRKREIRQLKGNEGEKNRKRKIW